MAPPDPAATDDLVTAAAPDGDTAEWTRTLTGTGPDHDRAVCRLHELLLRIARREINRREARSSAITGPERDDLAHQAAADALLVVLAKLDRFRGESRFTTWAYKIVVFEVSSKLGRHFWRTAEISMDADTRAWERLPDRFGSDPAGEPEWRDLLTALRRAVETELTEHQRRVFHAIVLRGVPLDALVVELSSNRNAIYKTLFDARRKLRASLVANGYMADKPSRRS
ncbi:MAG TPA: sigma-70 family RNA polymerase sigma factor [Pseudonocardiaceae bacterium]